MWVCDVVVRLGELRLEGEECPGALEDVLLLQLEQLRVGEKIAMNAERASSGRSST